MKRCIVALTLASFFILAVFTGCSNAPTRNDSSNSEDSSSSMGTVDDKLESSEVPEATESSSGANAVTPPSTSPSAPSSMQEESASEYPVEEKSSVLVNFNAAVFGFSQSTEIGTEEELQTWLNAMNNRDSISRIVVSSLAEERALTEDEVKIILDTLENLAPEVLDQLSNPPSGRDMNVIAFDNAESELWRVSVNEVWLTVQVAGDPIPRIFGIEGQSISDISSISNP